jgi:hypothetical protein
MSLFVLEAVFRLFGVRGHIPGHDDFHGGPDRPSIAANSRLMRILAVFLVVAAVLSLLVWAAVWLAVKLL